MPTRHFLMCSLLLSALGCVGPGHGREAMCDECRQFAVETLQVYRTGRNFRTETRQPRRHECSECQSEVRVEDRGGIPVLHCPKCAPAGIDCEVCESLQARRADAARG